MQWGKIYAGQSHGLFQAVHSRLTSKELDEDLVHVIVLEYHWAILNLANPQCPVHLTVTISFATSKKYSLDLTQFLTRSLHQLSVRFCFIAKSSPIL